MVNYTPVFLKQGEGRELGEFSPLKGRNEVFKASYTHRGDRWVVQAKGQHEVYTIADACCEAEAIKTITDIKKLMSI